MQKLGENLRKIRKSRNISVEQVAKGIASYSSIASFERGESLLSLDVLIKLLDRLNISITEFLNLAEISDTSFSKQYREFALTAYSEDMNSMEKIVNNLEKQTNFDHVQERLAYLNYKILLSWTNQEFKLSQNEEEFLLNYFWNCEIWTDFDNTLLCHSINIFNSENILIFCKELMKNIEELNFEGSHTYSRLRTILNGMYTLWDRQEIEKCKFIIDWALKNIRYNNFRELSFFKVFDNFVKYKETKNPQLLIEVEAVINYLHFMGNFSKYEYFKEELEKLKKDKIKKSVGN